MVIILMIKIMALTNFCNKTNVSLVFHVGLLAVVETSLNMFLNIWKKLMIANRIPPALLNTIQ